jgi:hypothetical protein
MQRYQRLPARTLSSAAWRMHTTRRSAGAEVAVPRFLLNKRLKKAMIWPARALLP